MSQARTMLMVRERATRRQGTSTRVVASSCFVRTCLFFWGMFDDGVSCYGRDWFFGGSVGVVLVVVSRAWSEASMDSSPV